MLALVEAGKQQRELIWPDFALASGATVLALMLSLAIGRWRNLGSFTRMAFWFTLLMLLGESKDLVMNFAKAGAETSKSSDDFVPHKAPGGNVTLLAPRSWSVRPTDTGSAISIFIASPGGTVLAAVTERVADFDSRLDLSGYTEILRAAYATKFEASFGDAESRTIGDVPVQRLSFEGSLRGVRLKGYIYLAKTELNFCHIVTYTSPTQFDELEAMLVSAIEQSRID